MSANSEQELLAALVESRAETRAAFENRALIYAHLLDEIEAELGLERAVNTMKRAIYRRGAEIGERYRAAVEAGDLAELGRKFVESSPCGGALFAPGVEDLPSGVEESVSERILLRMTACPLVEAWREAGCSPERVDLLCEIAAAVDYGTFEGAGLELEFLDRQACPGSERCLLCLRPRQRPFGG